MGNLSLVLGASGHLGNNLVRELLKEGHIVRASVRNPSNDVFFEGLDCEIVRADLMDKNSLKLAMKEVDVLYVAAAVYKSWAVNIKKEIMDINIQGTRNAIEAAAESGIKKVIYISTSLAANHDKEPIDAEGWNTNFSDPYRASKTEAEKLAWDLAKKHELWMVSILPSALVGPHCYGHLTPSMGFLQKVLDNQIPIDPNFYFNYIDIRDVVYSIRIAADKGKNGERYLLCQDSSISSSDVFQWAHTLDPKVIIPNKKPYVLMLLAANIMKLKSKFTKRQPMMLPSQVKSFYRANKLYDTSKAKRDLDFKPKSQPVVLKDVMYLMKNQLVER
jgi:nucleoside-diphosphate-sugar epimerase